MKFLEAYLENIIQIWFILRQKKETRWSCGNDKPWGQMTVEINFHLRKCASCYIIIKPSHPYCQHFSHQNLSSHCCKTPVYIHFSPSHKTGFTNGSVDCLLFHRVESKMKKKIYPKANGREYYSSTHSFSHRHASRFLCSIHALIPHTLLFSFCTQMLSLLATPVITTRREVLMPHTIQQPRKIIVGKLDWMLNELSIPSPTTITIWIEVWQNSKAFAFNQLTHFHS